MIQIRGKNVNEIYAAGILFLNAEGITQTSQHGDTLEMPEPVSVMYENPRERILFDPIRDSNPFLNMFEALWILQGRNDVKFLKYLVEGMAKYSDDDETYYGAYGDRMIGGRYKLDQIKKAIERLRKNPDDRQVVIMIRERADMWYEGKDNPCNLLVSCKIRKGKLNIHVFNRSNDFVWGMTGTNVVQFSMLQEYMAGMIGCEVGTYHQTTDSMHIYLNKQWDKVKTTEIGAVNDPYETGSIFPCNMMANIQYWDSDLQEFFDRFDRKHAIGTYQTPFFSGVVEPMWDSFVFYKDWKQSKEKRTLINSQYEASQIEASDWNLICQRWLSRRGIE
jgi:thymidylate synthase